MSELETYNTNLNFDVKAFMFKLFSFWKWFLLILILALYVVYYQNIRREFPYTLTSKISVQDDKNPLVTANTNFIFNYGGISGKIQKVVFNLKSRKHHEKIVDSLGLHLSYLEQGRFYKTDIYGKNPFKFIELDSAQQLLDIPIKISFIDKSKGQIEINFDKNKVVKTQNFITKKYKNVPVSKGVFKQSFRVGDIIDLPFLQGIITLKNNFEINAGDEFFIQFTPFSTVVSQMNTAFGVNNTLNTPLLELRLTNKNKAKIVDYLNTSSHILSRDQLAKKNEVATNTITYIDNILNSVKGQLTNNADSLNNFKRSRNIFDIELESTTIASKIEGLKSQKEALQNSNISYGILRNYLKTSHSFTNFPAPALEGIGDGNINSNVTQIIALSVRKSNLEASVKSGAAVFTDINRKIEALKVVLLENINSVVSNINQQIKSLDNRIYSLKTEISKIPENQQKLQSIERKYLLSEQTYNLYLAKRSEAELIKASNVSDLEIIEPAKDTGQGRRTQNLNIRYIFAVFGSLMPFVIIAFIATFFDKKLHNPQDLEKITKIPLLGVVGKKTTKSNLSVFLSPRSSISESFGSIRANLSFFYQKKEILGSKTVLLTSSISGEGKTYCSINLASIFALSDKKTVLVGFDLRKPKIFEDFDLINDVGAVNYLIGQKSLDDVIKKTKVNNLDIILSGPIPPNPSELLISDKIESFFEELKKKYDYIVLDTPPVGLVADAFGLLRFVDTSIYVTRQDYTEKGMLDLINNKYIKKDITNLSIIYNAYDVKGHYGYSGGYSYGYGNYANGYHKIDVKPTLWRRLLTMLKIK